MVNAACNRVKVLVSLYAQLLTLILAAAVRFLFEHAATVTMLIVICPKAYAGKPVHAIVHVHGSADGCRTI